MNRWKSIFYSSMSLESKGYGKTFHSCLINTYMWKFFYTLTTTLGSVFHFLHAINIEALFHDKKWILCSKLKHSSLLGCIASKVSIVKLPQILCYFVHNYVNIYHFKATTIVIVSILLAILRSFIAYVNNKSMSGPNG